MKPSGPGVSVVTATYNERENIQLFVERVRESLKGFEHEIVIVNDSSPDGTYLEARRLADRALLMRKTGQTRSLLIGIKSFEYPTIVTVDADLENLPELIPHMLKISKRKARPIDCLENEAAEDLRAICLENHWKNNWDPIRIL